jgi:GT2 family glycosyltransferase
VDDPRSVGFVVIGRNEGERLLACMRSIPAVHPRVYVDSGSTDDSVGAAERAGFAVLSLDLARPFTAARARNEGFALLRAAQPALRYVHFVDGDCELAAGWLPLALAALDADAGLAAVCGRRRERHPERSLYNALCDAEWDTPVGEAAACGGDALFRSAALQAVDGFDPRLIAGEEPELCFRLRRAGWRILRLPAEMTRHDAAMTRFGQWWRRSVRAGYAYAEGAAMHGRKPPYYNLRPTLSVLLWAGLLPALCAASTLLAPPFGALLWLVYPTQVTRISSKERQRGRPLRLAFAIAYHNVLGKFAEATGALRYLGDRLRGRAGTLIEYKGAATPSGEAES